MKPRARYFFFYLSTFVCLPAAADEPAAAVQGRVLGPDRAPVAGVLVSLKTGSGILEPGVLTAADGGFRIEQVPAPGRYRIQCALGTRTQDGPEVRLASSDAIARVDVSLKLGFFEEVLVTDLREEQSRRDTPATVTALSRDTITELKPAHPGQLLSQVPGVWVNVTGGEGHQTAIRQPLTTNPVYLYLEDGVPTRSTGFFNHNALYEINVPMADGVEVAKGPGSALYGSDAIGGVVNVRTRSAHDAPGLGATAEGGAGGWRRAMVDGALARGANGVRAQVNLTHSDGWRDATAYDRQTATLRWDHARSANTSLKTVATFSRIDQQTAGSSALTEDVYLTHPARNLTPISYRDVTAFRLSADVTHIAGPTLLSAIPYFRYDSMGLLPNWALTFDPTLYDTQNTSYGLLAKVRRDLPALRGLVVAGVDVDLSPGGRLETQIRPGRETTPEGKTAFTSYEPLGVIYDYDATFLSVSPYVHAEASPTARLRLSAGLRFDHMQYEYDDRLDTAPLPQYQRPADATRSYDHLSPKLGITYRVAGPVDAFASYRHAFRAPSEGQLFRQGTARDTIDLRPVRADNLEVGLRLRPARQVSIEVSAYQLDKRDDVLSYRNPVDGATEAVNAGHTRHRGVEIGLSARPTAWLQVAAGYSRARHTYEEWVVDPARNVDYSGNEMETAPRDIGNVLVSIAPTSRLRASLEVVRLGRYWMDAANTQAYRGHTLLNARASFELRRNVRLYARVLNAGDVLYAESASYTQGRGRELAPGAPRQAFFGVSVGR